MKRHNFQQDVENVQPKSTHEHPVEAMLKLQYRKDMLENRLKEKCTELMQLCKKEYELTGVVPMEAPDDFGGSPPKIRRRIATMFPYDGELLKQLSQPAPAGECLKRKPLSPWNSCDDLPSKSTPISPKHYTWTSPQGHHSGPGSKPLKTRSEMAKSFKFFKKWHQ
ncbi:Domain of unknown function (DUF3338) [Nesidiocoris tenuis]|uniref:Cytohesin Ubiquitin Protein Inducing domain-containing protein n=1 Tax=Nesidiocoris tenuis TaxID=355587 RepID=A0ABN7A5Z4_9HEMI|nr:Domain of unknown function (DUF3338) [Nesidiocoris tenuis]